MNQLNLFWETWLDVVGYEGLYQVNGRGDVKSLKFGKERILKSSKSRYGYLIVSPCKEGKKKSFRVHRLVWEAFYGKIPDGMEIDHIDGNKLNNSVDNLRCVTSKENKNNPITKKKLVETIVKLYQNLKWRKKVTDAVKKANSKPVNQYTVDWKFMRTWNSALVAQRELGISQSSISACCLGKRKSAGGFNWKYAS